MSTASQWIVSQANKYIGQLPALLLVMILASITLELIWNYVLYERIEGIDYITYYDALAIVVLCMCVRVVFLFW
jgi:hypothetical protein